MKLIIKITDDECKMLKAYAAAKRKYEVGICLNFIPQHIADFLHTYGVI